MATTKVTTAIPGEVFAWFKRGGRWERVRVVAAVQVRAGGLRAFGNVVRFGDGAEREVNEELLRFGREPRG
jgi:hypothetical protein